MENEKQNIIEKNEGKLKKKLEKYKADALKIKAKKKYQKYEKGIFEYLEKYIDISTKKNYLTKKKISLSEILKDIFQTMLEIRWNTLIKEGKTSKFYNLLCKVCKIDENNKDNKPIIKIKIEDILSNIQKNPIYNGTKNKIKKIAISSSIKGIATIPAVGGFFSAILSNLPIDDLIEMKGKPSGSDVGYSTMSPKLWKKIGKLSDIFHDSEISVKTGSDKIGENSDNSTTKQSGDDKKK